MKRRGFLASIAAGLGLVAIPEPKDMEKYYKVETIDRCGRTPEEVQEKMRQEIQTTALLQCSGTLPMCSG